MAFVLHKLEARVIVLLEMQNLLLLWSLIGPVAYQRFEHSITRFATWSDVTNVWFSMDDIDFNEIIGN